MPLSDLFQPDLRPPERTPSMSLNEFVYGKKEPEGRGFMGYLELLGRPQLALGESIGALARDENVTEAAKRGWRGERKYGTLGEQIFDPQEAPTMEATEAMFRKAAATGVDVFTDPTWLVGLPAVGKLAGVAGKALPHVSKLPYLREAAKYVVPLTTQLRWFGGKAGRKIAHLVDSAEDAKNLRSVQAGIELAQAAKTHGVGRSTALRNAAKEHLESGALAQGVIHPDQRVQGFAKGVDDLLTRTGIEIRDFRDLSGEGFQITEPVLRSVRSEVITKARKLGLSPKIKNDLWSYVTTGVAPASVSTGFRKLADFTIKKLDAVGYTRSPGAISIFNKEFYQRPFEILSNYFPHLPTPDLLKALGTKEGFSKAVKEMAKMNGISEPEAAKILKSLGSPRRAGNIEYARTMNFPDYEKDPLRALPIYFEQVFGRLEYAKRFGIKGQELNSLFKYVVTRRLKRTGKPSVEIKGLSKTDVGLIRDAILGKPLDKIGLERVARTVMGYQVMTKMGPLSAIANLSQNANTVVREGGISFLKGVLRGTTNEGIRQGKVAFSTGTRRHLLRMIGVTGKWPERWLNVTMFTPFERVNRLLGANAGIVEAERLLRRSGGVLTQNLARRGLTQADIALAKANNWKLPTEVADKIGMLASNATQHVTSYKDIPVAWQSPGIKTMVQFKSFVYQQTRFLMREIMKPALEYFNSNGKKGSVAPLLRATATFGLGGQFVAYIRDQAQTLSAQVLKMEHEPREAVPDDWALRVLQDSLNMGGLGIAGDLAQRAVRRDFKGWLLGPTWGDVSDLFETAARGGAEVYKEGELDLTKIGAEALRHVPGLSPILPKRELRKSVEEKLGSLGDLFYGI